MIIKSHKHHQKELMLFIQRQHAYDTPFIAKIATINESDCNSKYLEWINKMKKEGLFSP